jgi:hypothetical protein
VVGRWVTGFEGGIPCGNRLWGSREGYSVGIGYGGFFIFLFYFLIFF